MVGIIPFNQVAMAAIARHLAATMMVDLRPYAGNGSGVHSSEVQGVVAGKRFRRSRSLIK
jgi:hypothetical protein